MGHMTKASDCICCVCHKEKAVAFWPMVDIDIPAHPYCKKCLDEAQLKVMIQLAETDFYGLPKKTNSPKKAKAKKKRGG